MARGTIADLCRQAGLASDNQFDQATYREAAERIEELEEAAAGILAPALSADEVTVALTKLKDVLYKPQETH